MRKWRLLLTVLVFAVSMRQASAQFDPSFSHYWMMVPQYNPAAAGSTEYLRVVGAYSAQLSGYTDAPQTMYVGADLPLFFLHPNHGLGVSFLNDEIGLFSHKRFTVEYSYQVKLAGGHLRIGVEGDMLNETLDGSKADLEESNDPAFGNGQSQGSKLDAGAGLYYSRNDWYAGVSCMHLTAPTVTLGEVNEVRVERAYYFTGGYNIRLRNPLFTIKPTVFAMYDGHDYKATLSGRIEYNNEDKRLFGGASYSPDNSVALFVGGRFHGVVLSYSYEAYTTGIGIEHGAHEVVLSYEHKLNLYKKGKNLHKSVRLL